MVAGNNIIFLHLYSFGFIAAAAAKDGISFIGFRVDRFI